MKAVFTGCSFTAGNGWIDIKDSAGIACRDHPDLWVNLCHTQSPELNNLELVNLGQSHGASNIEIFRSTVSAIANYGADIKYLFVQWTAMPRYNFNAGLETWSTSLKMHRDGRGRGVLQDINLNTGETWSKDYLDDLLGRFLVLHHVHYEILSVVEYANSIAGLSDQIGIKVFFINGLCPWDDNYFAKLEGPDVQPENYTSFTKESILNIKSRSDEDIFKLYNQIHSDYANAGNIKSNHWINLYKSFQNSQLDTNFDRRHPGKLSNQLFSHLVKQSITL